MSNKRNFLLLTTSFLGGFALGILLSPQKGAKNMAWFSKNADKLKRWTTLKQQFTKRRGFGKLRKLRKTMNQGINKNVPDLYEATENIPLSEKDLTRE